MNTENQTHEQEVKFGTSASNAQADELCEGRHQAQIGLTSETTEDNLFGQQIHDALVNDDPSKLRADQLSVYESCVEIRERLIADTFGPDFQQVRRFKEERVWFKSVEGFVHSAKLDLLVRHGPKGLIIEYKTLPGKVAEAPTNKQLRDQLALASGHYLLTEVDVAIIQPLITHTPSVCRYDEAAILQSQTEMADRIQKSNAPNAPRTAGTIQCKFCLARWTCKEYAAFTALAVPVSMSSLTVPVSMWSPEQRALFCERLPVAMKWLEECRSKIKQLLEADPSSVPGWKLEPGSVKKPVNNPNELHLRFLAAGGTTEQFLLCVEIGKGNLEQQVRAVTKLKGKGLKSKIDEMLAGIVDEKQDAPSLGVIK